MKNGIYIKILEFGVNHPDGFTYEEIEKSLHLNEWEKKIVNKFVDLALTTGRPSISSGSLGSYIPESENSLFFLIANESGAERFILTHIAFFNYIDYLELQAAKETSVSANRNAKTALWAVVFTALLSIATSYFFARWQVESPVTIDEKQYDRVIEHVGNNNSTSIMTVPENDKGISFFRSPQGARHHGH